MGGIDCLQAARFRWWQGFAISQVVARCFSFFNTGDSLSQKILDRQFDLLQQRAHLISLVLGEE